MNIDDRLFQLAARISPSKYTSDCGYLAATTSPCELRLAPEADSRRASAGLRTHGTHGIGWDHARLRQKTRVLGKGERSCSALRACCCCCCCSAAGRVSVADCIALVVVIVFFIIICPTIVWRTRVPRMFLTFFSGVFVRGSSQTDCCFSSPQASVLVVLTAAV